MTATTKGRIRLSIIKRPLAYAAKSPHWKLSFVFREKNFEPSKQQPKTFPSANPTCSLRFPIAARHVKAFANLRPLIYNYNLSKFSATYQNSLLE